MKKLLDWLVLHLHTEGRSYLYRAIFITCIINLLTTSIAFAIPVSYDASLKESSLEPVNTFAKDRRDPLRKILKTPELMPIGRIVNPNPIPVVMSSGKIEVRLDVQTTGFLISPCLVLTNYHSVFGKSKKPNRKAPPVTFTANREVLAKPIAWGGRDRSDAVRFDWAVLELDQKDCLGLEVGWLKQLESSFFDLKNQNLTTAGYPGDRGVIDPPKEIWTHGVCARYPSASNPEYYTTIFNDCALTGGQSGSPLLVRNDAGELRFIGMQAADLSGQAEILENYDIHHGNMALYLRPILNEFVVDLITADIKKHGRN